MMPSIFWMFLVASLVHIGEEYIFPGGFMQFMRQMIPRWSTGTTTPFALLVNGVFLLLVLAAMLVGEASLIFSLSIAALLGINGMVHVIGTIITRRYVPGVISGLLLYIPLAVSSFAVYLGAQKIDMTGVSQAFGLGLLYHFATLITLLVFSRRAA